jgi:hypothetical protein
MSRFKTIDISKYWDDDFFVTGQRKEIIIRKISFGEISKLQKMSVDAKMTGTIQNVSFDIEKSRNMLILAGIKMAPNLLLEDGKELRFVSGELRYIENLPNTLGQYIYEEIEKFNAPDPKE